MTGLGQLARRLAGLFVLAMLASCGQPAATSSADSKQKDIEAIQALLTRIQQTFNAGQLDTFMPAFAQDAIVSAQANPDYVGAAAIREMYAAAMSQMNIQVSFDTKEIEVSGDLAYESGTYTLKLADKATGQSAGEVTNRHVHIFRRQPDGSWKTWRMMTNSAEAAPAGGGESDAS
jgi:uncharacterized protein (TIGR02246 family)